MWNNMHKFQTADLKMTYKCILEIFINKLGSAYYTSNPNRLSHYQWLSSFMSTSFGRTGQAGSPQAQACSHSWNRKKFRSRHLGEDPKRRWGRGYQRQIAYFILSACVFIHCLFCFLLGNVLTWYTTEESHLIFYPQRRWNVYCLESHCPRASWFRVQSFRLHKDVSSKLWFQNLDFVSKQHLLTPAPWCATDMHWLRKADLLSFPSWLGISWGGSIYTTEPAQCYKLTFLCVCESVCRHTTVWHRPAICVPTTMWHCASRLHSLNLTSIGKKKIDQFSSLPGPQSQPEAQTNVCMCLVEGKEPCK